MNFKATASSIAASGGIRPDSHITARPVTARKAGPVALTLVAATLSIVLGGTTVAIAGVIEGRPGDIPARSDLSPSSTLTGQRRHTAGAAFLAFLGNRRPARSGGGYGLWPATALHNMSPHYRRNLGNPCAEKVRPHRARQNNVSEPALVAGVGGPRQGTLTITGSNVRLGTEMPVALSSFL